VIQRPSRPWAVAGFFVVLTLALAYPLGLEPQRRALDLGADTRLFLWTLAWDMHVLAAGPLHFFDANIFFPERFTLAYSENLAGVSLLAAPWWWATGNLLLAMNAASLTLCALSGFGTYCLGRRLGLSHWGALLAGVVFAFAPPRLFRLGQLHMSAVAYLPFCLAFLCTYARTRRPAQLRWAAWFFALQALSSGHGALLLALAVALLVLHWRFTNRGLSLARVARDLGLGGLLPAGLVLLCFAPYLHVRGSVGLHRDLGEARRWSPNAQSFLAAPTYTQKALLGLLPGGEQRVLDEARTFLFPGWMALGLAALALRRRGRASTRPTAVRARAATPLVLALEAAAASAGAVALLVYALGGVQWRAFGRTLSAHDPVRALIIALLLVGLRLAAARHAPSALLAVLRRGRNGLLNFLRARTGLARGYFLGLMAISLWVALGPDFGLYALLYHLVPGADLVRVPSRFATLTVLSLAVLAGLGFDRLARRSPTRTRTALRAVAFMVVVAECVAVPLDAPPYAIEIFAVDRYVATLPGGAPIVELPVADPRDEHRAGRLQAGYMVHSTVHWHPLVNGYSGFTPPAHARLFSLLTSFPDEPGLAQLEQWGVCYAVFHPRLYRQGEWSGVRERLACLSDRLVLDAAVEDGQVYRLVRSCPAAAGEGPGSAATSPDE